MGESEGELVRVSRRAVATRVGLWMNPMNGDVCVYERERESVDKNILIIISVLKDETFSNSWEFHASI